MTSKDFDSQKIGVLIFSALGDLAEELNKPDLKEANADAPLFGPGGNLDSLALVQLIAEIESRVSEEFGKDIAIADERAMSRSRSPFRTVATLRDYLAELLAE